MYVKDVKKIYCKEKERKKKNTTYQYSFLNIFLMYFLIYFVNMKIQSFHIRELENFLLGQKNFARGRYYRKNNNCVIFLCIGFMLN